MNIFIVRLNPDTRNCIPYSKYPTKKEYCNIQNNAPMNGFHEAVNFLSEDGIVRGYLPPKHLNEMKSQKPFILITITAKTAPVGGDQIIGVQAGCRYRGENLRTGGNKESKSLNLSWFYYCPESLSVLFTNPISNARSQVLEDKSNWGMGPTRKSNLDVLSKIVKKAISEETDKRIISKLQSILSLAKGKSILANPKLKSESTFEQDILDALNENLADISGNKNPQQREVQSYQYIRDPKVVAYALRKADGVCADCGQRPFISRITGLPYLEVHHIVMLKNGGQDTIDNVIALCPNCHRKRHYG